MPEIMTIQQLAEYLQMTRRQVYEMTSERGRARMESNPLPLLRLNGAVRFVRADIEAWLQRERGAA